ncbi:MAG: DUF3427 domain-containing protein [Bacteroidaceae bacterium]|nr:DUF3427 domain-containing protein [Bacteroidaceae bacterium]
MHNNNIPTGVYEQIINRLIQLKLNEVDANRFYIGKKQIAKDDAVHILSKYLQHLIEVAFIGTPESQDADKYTDFVNSVIKTLGREFNVEESELDLIDAQKSILTAVIDRTNCEYPDIEEHLLAITPVTTLSRSALFFGGKGPADMESELNREILCADEICWVVSFIKMSGLNLLWDSLKKFTSEGKRLRIITTTYTGATDYDAIVRLATLSNTEIKISYDGTQDRLHAKSYIFLRNSGFHTAYIGSSNLSRYALKDGKEWNFKATQFELPQVIEEVRNSFEAYWCDVTFEDFIPGMSNERLKKALGADWETPLLDFSALDLMRAKDYQQEILEKLDVERNVHGHYRNLVVAATGTGKTVIAAFDFKRYREAHPDCHFLFIAHRQEILRQAMQTFRIVLDDPNFGSIWDGDNEPSSYQHVFASKDTLRNRVDNLQLTEDYYDYMVVDEVHHIVAPTYVKLMTCFKPQILLGLTATPERTNEQEDITTFFDGHISAEIRLPAALNAGLLAPFHYYGIPDNVDLSEVRWSGHGYEIAELSRIYTQNDFRTGLILKKMQEYIGDSRLHKVRSLCFCVDKEHAKFMNAKFTLAGLKTAVLTSDDNDYHRRLVKRQLQEGVINYLFVVDLFNEGVDIPEIDTILFLRPTESATVFLQQFGRGLRLHKGKDHLTVLDFVGHSRAEFNYKERFESLIGRHSRSILTEIKEGFQNAPFGCKIILEEKAKEEVVANIEGYLRSLNKNRIIKEIAAYHEANKDTFSLKGFMAYSHVPFHKIYGSVTWGELCQLADIQKEVSPHASLIKFAVTKKWLSTDSYTYFTQLLRFVDSGFKCDTSAFTERERRFAVMFYYDLFDTAGNYASIAEMFSDLAQDQLFIQEIKEVIEYLRDRCSAPEKNDNSVYNDWSPLRLHGVYTKAQIQAALGLSTLERKSSSREGVERLKSIKLEAMYVDIIKKREEGSMTAYRDFAQNREFFHWETQNRVREGSREAEAYLRGDNNMLLFVRQQADHPDYSCRMGFTYLGQVTMKSIEGSRPMQIVWHLNTPMSEATYAFASQYKAIG